MKRIDRIYIFILMSPYIVMMVYMFIFDIRYWAYRRRINKRNRRREKDLKKKLQKGVNNENQIYRQ